MKRRVLTEKEKQEMKNDILANFPVSYIMEKYSVPRSTCYKIVAKIKKEIKINTEITKELRAKVIIDAKNGIQFDEIAKKFNIKISSVMHIIMDYNAHNKDTIKIKADGEDPVSKEELGIEAEEPIEETASQQKVYSDNIIPVTKVSLRKKIPCQLISGRHVFPTNRFILKGPLPQNMIFDYTSIETSIKKFISNFAIDEYGKVNADLYVYVTGMQSALACLIKICGEIGVNLTLIHYCTTAKEMYSYQPIYNNFGESSYPYCFRNIYNEFKNDLFTYRCSTYDLKDCEIIYIVKDTQKNQIIITSNYDSAIIYYCKLISEYKINCELYLYSASKNKEDRTYNISSLIMCTTIGEIGNA